MKYNPDHKCSCPICGTLLSETNSYTGPYVTYTNKIEIDIFSFDTCAECGLSINNKYKKIDFDHLKYDNNLDPLKEDKNDNLIEENILYFVDSFLKRKNPSNNLTLIEIGAGSRLSLLSNLEKKLNCYTYAIDPLYEDSLKSLSIENINFLSDMSELPKIQSSKILIARNVIEYLTPKELENIINQVFDKNGLLILEIQPLNQKRWGSIFTFTEYKTFYTNLALNKLIRRSHKHVEWITLSHIFGEKRNCLFGYISDQELTKNNIIYHSNINSLCNKLKSEKSNRPIKLWGSGGRSLMFLYNEGKSIIDDVVDSSIKRQGILLPGFDMIKSPSSINDGDVIILLNSRYLKEVIDQIPKNCILHSLEVD